MFARAKRKFTIGMRRLALTNMARRFVHGQDGVAAIEFGLVATPFIALLFAIIETAMVFFAGQTLEAAVADSSRLIFTGQAQLQSFDAAAFKTQVCNRIYGIFDCQGGLQIDVRTATSFAAASVAKPVDGNGNVVNNFVYQPGNPGDIVIVRVIYQFPVYVSLLGFNLSDLSGGKRLIMATAVFRNEPYK